MPVCSLTTKFYLGVNVGLRVEWWPRLWRLTWVQCFIYLNSMNFVYVSVILKLMVASHDTWVIKTSVRFQSISAIIVKLEIVEKLLQLLLRVP